MRRRQFSHKRSLADQQVLPVKAGSNRRTPLLKTSCLGVVLEGGQRNTHRPWLLLTVPSWVYFRHCVLRIGFEYKWGDDVMTPANNSAGAPGFLWTEAGLRGQSTSTRQTQHFRGEYLQRIINHGTCAAGPSGGN